MSEKYYVVSESELNRLVSDALNTGYNTSALYGPEGSEAACRARPVPAAAKYVVYLDSNGDEIEEIDL